jgi:hypothetical protein
MSKITAKIIKKHAMQAGHGTGSDPMFQHGRRLQKKMITVLVLDGEPGCACRMVTRATHGLPRGMQEPRFSALWWCRSCRWEDTHSQ